VRADGALFSNTLGQNNTASGYKALFSNTDGSNNTATGYLALFSNTGGFGNTAAGIGALESNSTGDDNTAVGRLALGKSVGNGNIAVGTNAGGNLARGDQNIYVGNAGAATESNTIRLGSAQTRTFIAGVVNTPMNGAPVVINGKGRLGSVVSSARYKKDIQDMGKLSRKLLELRPVTFHYKDDSHDLQQYGLIAEEVAQVYPELVTRTATGEAASVQYYALVSMLLNELQHQERQIAELTARTQELGELKAQNAVLAARLTRLEQQATRPASDYASPSLRTTE